MDKIYVLVDRGKIESIERQFDDSNPQTGVFRKTSTAVEIGGETGYLCYVDKKAENFPNFSLAFQRQFSQFAHWRKYIRRYEENPENADIVNLLSGLEDSKRVTFYLPADPMERTPWLQNIFKWGVLSVEGKYKNSKTPTNRVMLSFDGNQPTGDQKTQLMKYCESIHEEGASEEAILMRYGPDYLNLFLFAREKTADSEPEGSPVEKKESPDQPPLAEEGNIDSGTSHTEPVAKTDALPKPPAERKTPRVSLPPVQPDSEPGETRGGLEIVRYQPDGTRIAKRPDQREVAVKDHVAPVDYEAIYNHSNSRTDFKNIAAKISEKYGPFTAECRLEVTVNPDGSVKTVVKETKAVDAKRQDAAQNAMEADIRRLLPWVVGRFPWPIQETEPYSFEKTISLQA